MPGCQHAFNASRLWLFLDDTKIDRAGGAGDARCPGFLRHFPAASFENELELARVGETTQRWINSGSRFQGVFDGHGEILADAGCRHAARCNQDKATGFILPLGDGNFGTFQSAQVGAYALEREAGAVDPNPFDCITEGLTLAADP